MPKNSGKILQGVILAGALFLLPVNCLKAGLNAGARAPDFELPDLNGRTVSLSDMLRGDTSPPASGPKGPAKVGQAGGGDKPVVLSFFGTWCDSCVKEINDLSAIAGQYNAAVYLVGVDADKKKLVRFAEKHKIQFPILWDPKGKTMGRKYDLFRGAFVVVPKVFIIAPTGAIEYVGESYDAERRDLLKNKLAEVSGKKWDKPSEVAVFFTGSANGYLESCNCYKHPYGGFVKLVSFLKRQAQKYPNRILLDSGDFLPYGVSDVQADFTLKAMAIAGYDAIAAGDQDMYFKGFMKAVGSKKFPFIASNIVWKPGAPGSAGLADKTMSVGGISIRILSFAGPETFSLYPGEFTDKIGFKDLKEVLKGGRNADFLILLLHAGADDNKKIAAEFREFDLIIGGHSQTLLNKPIKAGGALIAQAGGNLQQAGKIVLRFDGDRKLSGYTYEIVPLINEIPDDPQVKALIGEYKAAAKQK